jgi:hypothetical protein
MRTQAATTVAPPIENGRSGDPRGGVRCVVQGGRRTMRDAEFASNAWSASAASAPPSPGHKPPMPPEQRRWRDDERRPQCVRGKSRLAAVRNMRSTDVIAGRLVSSPQDTELVLQHHDLPFLEVARATEEHDQLHNAAQQDVHNEINTTPPTASSQSARYSRSCPVEQDFREALPCAKRLRHRSTSTSTGAFRHETAHVNVRTGPCASRRCPRGVTCFDPGLRLSE